MVWVSWLLICRLPAGAAPVVLAGRAATLESLTAMWSRHGPVHPAGQCHLALSGSAEGITDMTGMLDRP